MRRPRGRLAVVLRVLPLGAWLALGPATASADFVREAVAPHEGKIVASIGTSGANVTRSHVISREIETRAGEPLSLATLEDDVQRLLNLQIFSNVRVEAEPAEGGQVTLRFLLTENSSWLPGLAFAYTEENGVSIGPSLSAVNFGGRDIDGSVKAYFGGTTQYVLQMGWPWIGGEDHLGMGLRAAHLQRADELNGFEETSDEFSPRVSRYLGRKGRASALFSYLHMKSDVDGKTLSPDNSDHLVRLGASLGWDTRDNWGAPHEGWLNELEVWQTGALGGDGSFWTGTLDVRRWQPLARRQRILFTALTTLQSGAPGVDVPIYMDYHLGGANTIRGYDFAELGKTLYGKNQMLGTLEYSVTALPSRPIGVWKIRLRLGVELAAFADAGIAWSEGRRLAMNNARGGIGAGVRLINPITEMIRLDFAWSPEGGFHFHFGVSKAKKQRDRLR
jgi:outer membrane protein insertion porin family